VNGYDKDTLTVNHFIWGPTGGDKTQFDEDSWRVAVVSMA